MQRVVDHFLKSRHDAVSSRILSLWGAVAKVP